MTLPQGFRVSAQPPHFAYVLRHGEDNLIVAQRMSEWVSWAPDLEQDIAVGNIALDYLGQARALLQHAATLEGAGRTEDDLAMLRTERDFTNLLLVEQPNGDFGDTMARQLFYDAYQLSLWEALSGSADDTLAGIAAKALKEAQYHFRFSSTWVVRLGDGTDLSHRRMQAAVDRMWRYTGEMFEADEVDLAMSADGIGVDPSTFERAWRTRVGDVLSEAALRTPEDPYQRSGGRAGFHTEHLGHLLSDLQWMQRTYPEMSW